MSLAYRRSAILSVRRHPSPVTEDSGMVAHCQGSPRSAKGSLNPVCEDIPVIKNGFEKLVHSLQ